MSELNTAADGHYDRLPGLVEDLVTQHVAVITADFLPASLAAKAATQTIPIVFLTGSDPVAAGLVSSFSRPTGNVTGIAFMFTRLGPKNLEFLHELLPNIPVVAVLTNQTNPNGPPQVEDLLSFKPICDGRRFDELRGQPSGCIPRNRNLRRKNTQGRETC
jgi:putative ABC transport system substrate-binding protein